MPAADVERAAPISPQLDGQRGRPIGREVFEAGIVGALA
jgi:hypothetical protein